MIKIHKGTGGPKFLMDILARYYLPGLLQQQGQKLKRLVLQLDFHPVLAQLPRTEVQLEGAEANQLIRLHVRLQKGQPSLIQGSVALPMTGLKPSRRA